MELINRTQASWLEKLYEANLQRRGAIAVTPRVFSTLKALKYAKGKAEAATITPEGTSVYLRYRQEVEKAAKEAKKARKGKACSQNSQTNTDQTTFNFQ